MDPSRTPSAPDEDEGSPSDEVDRLILDPPEAEVRVGRFSVLCPRQGVHADVRIERVSGSARFSCSVPGDDTQARQRCQAACARWVLGGA